MRSETLLDIVGLNVDFPAAGGGSVRVVADLDLTVGPGEMVALVGESGSGKTLTALAIMGLLDLFGASQSATRMTLGQTDLLTADRARMRSLRGREVGMIFQQPMSSLDPAFSVGSQIAGAIRAHEKVTRKAAWQRAVELLDRVQIPHASRRAHDFPHQFSGGMCQRVMIAIAMACRPQLIIADEPTTALDVRTQAEFLDLLNELRSESDAGVLYISHDLAVVSSLADRIAVMYSGEIVESGTAEALLADPQHPYTSGLIGSVCRPGQERTFVGIPGRIPVAGSVMTGCRFAPRCEYVDPEGCLESRIPLTSGIADSAVRCRRHQDLQLAGVRR